MLIVCEEEREMERKREREQREMNLKLELELELAFIISNQALVTWGTYQVRCAILSSLHFCIPRSAHTHT
jgi:hypothetical protein